MVYGVIYLITCLINGKSYIGQTTRSIRVRFREHARRNSPLGNAIRKYGVENFNLEVIEECETLEQLNEREIFWVSHFNCMVPNGYNLTGGGEGYILSPEQISKRSANATKMWASRTVEKRSEIAKRREARKSPEARSESAKKSAATRNLNPNMHAKMSRAHRNGSSYKNLLSEIDKGQFSYKRLATLLDISQANISRKMRGERNFTAKDISKLVEIFGKTAEYLMTREN